MLGSLKYLFTVGLISLLLSSCASKQLLPVANDQAVLVLPKVFVNKSFESWVRRYLLVVSKIDENGDAHEFRNITLSEGKEAFQLVTDLSPGSYELSRLKWITGTGWNSIQAMGEGYPLKIPFALEKAKITILPYDLKMTQEDRGSGLTSIMEAQVLDSGKQLAIIQSLKKLPNAGLWNL